MCGLFTPFQPSTFLNLVDAEGAVSSPPINQFAPRAKGSAPAGGMAMMCAVCPKHARYDELFEKNEYAKLVTLLRGGLADDPDDAELLWRLARALKKQADAAPVKETKVALLHEALQLA